MLGDQNYLTKSFKNIQNSLTTVSNRLSTLVSNFTNNLFEYLHNYVFDTNFSTAGILDQPVHEDDFGERCREYFYPWSIFFI